jgi:hypothetical protein
MVVVVLHVAQRLVAVVVVVVILVMPLILAGSLMQILMLAEVLAVL